MFQFIYSLPLLFSVLCAFAVWFLWAFFNYKYESINGRSYSIWKSTNAVIAIVITFLILYTTVFSRSGDTYKVIVTPFYSFAVVKEQPEMWRQLLMNIIMFLPFGTSLACLVGKKTSARAAVAIVTVLGTLLSLLIELLQYFYHLGEAWTDDVICNALGAFWGALVLIVPKIFKNKDR